MTFVIDVARLCLRLCVTLALILGIALWSGHAIRELPIHMAIGVVLVLSLWTIAVTGLIARTHQPLAIVALAWGGLILWLGINQTHLMLGDRLHWMVRTIHLLVGLAGVGIGEALATRILAERRRAAGPA